MSISNEYADVDFGSSPVILAFTNGISLITHMAFLGRENKLALKNAYLITRRIDGNMIIVKFLPESANDIITIETREIFTIAEPAKEILETYGNVLYGKSEFETIH